jgi:hypothetical protein
VVVLRPPKSASSSTSNSLTSMGPARRVWAGPIGLFLVGATLIRTAASTAAMVGEA